MALSAKEKRLKRVLSLEFPLEWKRFATGDSASHLARYQAETRFGTVRLYYRAVYRYWEAELPDELAGPKRLSLSSDTLSRLKDRVVNRMVTIRTVNPVTTRDWLLSRTLERDRRYAYHLSVLRAVEEMTLAASEAGPDHNATLASLGQAALANPRDLPVLADWLEEYGHTLPSSGNRAPAQATAVRELASVVHATQVEKLAAAARLA